MLRKIVTITLIAFVVGTAFISCSSAPEEKEEVPVTRKIIGQDGVPMPDWVNKNPKSETHFYAVGYAMKSSRAISKTASGQDARDQIARWVGTSVKNALVSYTSEGGEQTNTQTLSHFENISKQVAEQTLVGVEEDEIWVDDKGGVYMLCSFPKANLNKSFEETVGTFQRNEAAAFAEFKAKEALSFLEKETADGVQK
ncbi:MAG TPA: LPP20 family lipoprotein [Treponemataceae bacterium]|nr:LPP20 family lipoprotein [Treponemataceae bacterium]